MTNNLVTRLTVEGKAELIAAATEAHTALSRAGQVTETSLSRAMDRAGGLVEFYGELAQAAKRAAESEADRAQAMARNDSLSQQLGVRSFGSGAAQASADVFDYFERQRVGAEALRRQLDPLYDAEVRHAGAMADVQAMYDAGALSQDLYRQKTEQLTAALEAQRAAADTGASGGSASTQGHIDSLVGVREQRLSAAQSEDYVANYTRLLQDQERAIYLLKMQLDPMAAAQERYNATLAHLNTLKPHIGIEMYEKALEKAKGDLDRFERSQSAGLDTHTTTQLSFQLNDVITGLMTGQEAGQVFLQQIGQIIQALQTSPGGMAATLRTLALRYGPAILAGGAFTAMLVTGVSAALAYEAANNRAAVALMGVGAASGLSTASLGALTQQAALAGDMSVRSAEASALAMMNAGMTNKDVMKDAIVLSKDWAMAMGKELPDAAEDLGRILADPKKGADELANSIYLFNSAQVDAIGAMVEAGDTAGAQAKILEALEGRIGTATEKVYGWAGAWDWLSARASNAFRELGKGLNPSPRDTLDIYASSPVMWKRVLEDPSDRDRWNKAYMANWNTLAEQSAANNEAEANKADLESNGRLQFFDPKTERRELIGQRLAKSRDDFKQGLITPEEMARIEAGAKKLYAALDPPERGAGRAARLAREVDSILVNTAESWKLADAYLKGEAAAFKAEVARKALTEATKKGIDTEAAYKRALDLTIAETAAAGGKRVGDLIAMTAAQDEVNRAVAAGTVPAERAYELLQLEQQKRPLITAAAVAEGEAKTKLTEILNALTRAYEANASARAVSQFQAGSARDADAMAQLDLQLAMVGQSKREQEVAMAALKARQDIAASAIDINDPAALGAGLQHYYDAVNGARKRSEVDQAQYLDNLRRGQADSLSMLTAEAGLIGVTERERTRELAVLELKTQLVREGFDLGSSEAQQLLRNAALYEDMNADLKKRNELMEQQRQLGETTFQRMISFWDNWRQNGLDAIKDVAMQLLALSLINPASNKLFGTDLPTLSDVGGIGGFFKSMVPGLFGGTRSGADEVGKGAADAMNKIKIPSFAQGTDHFQGGWARVHRDELVSLPRGSAVHTAAETRSLFRGLNRAAAPVVVPAPNLAVDLGDLAGPVANLMNGFVERVNAMGAKATADAIETVNRNLGDSMAYQRVYG